MFERGKREEGRKGTNEGTEDGLYRKGKRHHAHATHVIGMPPHLMRYGYTPNGVWVGPRPKNF